MSWRFELLAKPFGGVTEGPLWDGESVLFTHIPTSRIMQYAPASGTFTEWRTGANHTNGLAFDAEGRIFGCCSGGRAIVRFDPDGSDVRVADRVDGQRLNTPNDLAVDRLGRIWFTNPWNAGNIDPANWKSWTIARSWWPVPNPMAATRCRGQLSTPRCPTASWFP